MSDNNDVLLLVARAIGRAGCADQDDPLDNVLDNLSPEAAAEVAMCAVPDGWATLDGGWVRVRRANGYADMVEHDGDVLLVEVRDD